jgi:hypothetical protein
MRCLSVRSVGAVLDFSPVVEAALRFRLVKARLTYGRLATHSAAVWICRREQPRSVAGHCVYVITLMSYAAFEFQAYAEKAMAGALCLLARSFRDLTAFCRAGVRL